jgi:hypothetical protein
VGLKWTEVDQFVNGYCFNMQHCNQMGISANGMFGCVFAFRGTKSCFGGSFVFNCVGLKWPEAA